MPIKSFYLSRRQYFLRYLEREGDLPGNSLALIMNRPLTGPQCNRNLLSDARGISFRTTGLFRETVEKTLARLHHVYAIQRGVSTSAPPF